MSVRAHCGSPEVPGPCSLVLLADEVPAYLALITLMATGYCVVITAQQPALCSCCSSFSFTNVILIGDICIADPALPLL